MNLRICSSKDDDREWIHQLWMDQFGDISRVIQHEIIECHKLEALIAWEDGERVGCITYRMKEDEAEIASLHVLRSGKGIGSRLVRALEEKARQWGLLQISLIITNDQLKWLAFYQKSGFRLGEVFWGAMDKARKIKPSIPLIGQDGIPIRDEWRLVKSL